MILLADDQIDVLQALKLLLKSEGMSAVAVQSPAAALVELKSARFEVALIDLNYSRDTTSGQEGLDLLRQLREADPELPVVVMTAWASIELAVKAMQLGASDFIEKPWDNRRVLSVLRNQIELGRSRRQSARLARENEILKAGEQEGFVAESAAMQPVLKLIQRVAPTTASILILGENGTGKSMIADLIHQHSGRAERSLVKVNMGGIAETVFESEMFGHVRGAFTDAKSDRIGRFELADGGSLFLDEIGNIPLSQQPKLLRVLEDGELERLGSSRTLKVDVRVISATNADLATDVEQGRFRKDLLFRLNTVELHLPPLRERREDLVPLARSYLAKFGRRYGKSGMQLAASAERALLAYRWPGNVRELSHVIERGVLMAGGSTLNESDLALSWANSTGAAPSGAAAGAPQEGASALHTAGSIAPALTPEFAHFTLDQAEEWLVRQALSKAGGNIQRSAEHLGLSRAALYRRLEKFGMREPGGISEPEE